MYRVFSPAFFVGQPRTIAPHVGAGLGVALATLLGCADPTRPAFPQRPGAGATPPSISVMSPTADTVVAGGSTVLVRVSVHGQARLTALTCAVSGVTAFAFPPTTLDDSVATVEFPIPTAKGARGTVTLTLSASDVFDNGSTTKFAFVVR